MYLNELCPQSFPHIAFAAEMLQLLDFDRIFTELRQLQHCSLFRHTAEIEPK